MVQYRPPSISGEGRDERVRGKREREGGLVTRARSAVEGMTVILIRMIEMSGMPTMSIESKLLRGGWFESWHFRQKRRRNSEAGFSI